MLNSRTIISSIAVSRGGTAEVQMSKQVFNQGFPDKPISSAYYRLAVTPTDDVEAKIAETNQALLDEQAGACSDEEWDLLRGIVGVAQTPERVAAYREKMRAEEAESERLWAEQKEALRAEAVRQAEAAAREAEVERLIGG